MLHWCPVEKNFILFTEEETEKIILDCMKNDITDFNDIYDVIGRFESLKIGALILERYLKNEILFSGVKRGDLAFKANNHDG